MSSSVAAGGADGVTFRSSIVERFVYIFLCEVCVDVVDCNWVARESDLKDEAIDCEEEISVFFETKLQ